MSRVIYESEKRITQHYGNNGHTGVDLGFRANEEQNKVFSNCDGKVCYVQTGYKNNKGSTGMASYGNMIEVDHGSGYKSRYAHLRSVNVKLGDHVSSQTKHVGIIGDTGNAYGRHLHYEVLKDGYRMNPEPYLTKRILGEVQTGGNVNVTEDYKVGDRVFVVEYAYERANGTGNKTAYLTGVFYITKVIDSKKYKYPFHVSRTKNFGQCNVGWVSYEQIKKV